MRGRILLGALLVVVPITAASAQDVQHFLARAEVLIRRGPFALFSPDFYRLKSIVDANGQELKAEYAREHALHHRTAFCPPAQGKPRVNKNEYLAALRAVPVNRRVTTDTKDVLRTVLERKYPCRR